MANVYRALLDVLPKNPLQVGTVVAADGDALRIQLADDTLASARGAYSVGAVVSFRRDGAVEGTAVLLPVVDIDI